MKRYNKSGIYVRNNIIYVQGGIDGVFYRKSTGKVNTKLNLTWATKNSLDILRELIGKEEHNKQNPNLMDFGYKSLEINSATRRETTNKEYLGTFERHILPYFKLWKLSDIKPTDIKAWQVKLSRQCSGKRISTIRGVFRGILQDAVIDEIIPKNPFDVVKRIKIEKVTIQPFTLEEVQYIIESSSGWFKNFLVIAFFTGMRVGEIIGLRWEDIDFEEETISVKRAIRKGIVSEPKTDNSIRTIDMLEPVKEALKHQYAITGKQDDYLFLTKEKVHYKHSEPLTRHYWRPLLLQCKIKHRILYQTRHSFASIMLQKGEDIGWISKMLGHADIHTTFTRYTKYVHREKKERAKFLCGIINI